MFCHFFVFCIETTYTIHIHGRPASLIHCKPIIPKFRRESVPRKVLSTLSHRLLPSFANFTSIRTLNSTTIFFRIQCSIHIHGSTRTTCFRLNLLFFCSWRPELLLLLFSQPLPIFEGHLLLLLEGSLDWVPRKMQYDICTMLHYLRVWF